MRQDWVRSSRVTVTLALVLSFHLAVAQQSAQPSGGAASAVVRTGESLPESPGAQRYQITAVNQQGSGAQPLPPGSTPAPKETQRQPVGTAAAEGITSTGVAASAPAGAAIAPAKQRQRRSLIIKTGAVLAASAAVGTAVALSSASPSRPPGAH